MFDFITMGIYKITNTETKQVYIGSSKNIYLRWGQHIDLLNRGMHHSSKLQECYNNAKDKSIFKLDIIEKVDNSDQLKIREQYYIDLYNAFDEGYNCQQISGLNHCGTDEQRFIDFINSKWLAPCGLEGHKLDKYKIYKEEDKRKIVNLATECKLFNLYRYQITFLRVMKLLNECLGYDIETGQCIVNKHRYTYKLIISFDESKYNYVPPFITET